ncbi:BON domain-containing protein [Hoeflea sp. TYP-13]|uniref:BON domain-containing protein n=1 Tax=Hoeflea sp. TYP-13 TaxID=3230023 RepID=UPI0034C65752
MLSDAQLKKIVIEELQWDPKVDHAHIGVTAYDGSITLSGHVQSYASKWAATDAAKRVKGVKAVGDEIEVNLPTERRHDDSDIAEHIAHVLRWNLPVAGKDVKASVSSGHVTLSGEVDWQYERDQIEEHIRNIRAVRSMSNHIKLKTVAILHNVKKEIEDAFRRSADLETKNIQVTVVGDCVTLEGEVKAHYERELAEKAAWAAPGVRQVVDQIRIA